MIKFYLKTNVFVKLSVTAFVSFLFAAASVPSVSSAADIGFANVSKSEVKDVITDFSAAFSHTSVSSAASLGTIFGFEVGLIAGASNSDTIDALSKETDSSADFDRLPHAALLGAVTFPFGITGEINFLPEIKNSDVEFKTGSLAVKWTPTDIWELPVELAVKLQSAGSEITWVQPISSVDTQIVYKQKVTGLLFQVSKKFLILEPYFSIGPAKAVGKLKVKGTGTIFDTSYTTEQTVEEEVSGLQTQLGGNINLGFIKFGAEVGKVLDVNKASLKASLYF